MTARELKQCEHFSSPAFKAVYITQFLFPADFKKASQNTLLSTDTICITQLGLEYDLKLVFFSHFNFLSLLSVFVFNIKHLLDDSLVIGSTLRIEWGKMSLEALIVVACLCHHFTGHC